MASRVRRCRLAAPVVVALWLVSTSSMADPTKDQCVDANAKAQDFRRSGKLSAAREQLRLCTSASCPSMVRDDCTKRLDELETAQATIAFEVKDASGADVSAVTVTVDGQPFASTLDGTALPVDRGSHVFVFTVAGQPPVTRTFVLTEGEKGRREKVVLGEAAPLAAPEAERPATGSSAVEPALTRSGMGTQKILGLVAGGIGVAGIVSGSVFGAMALSEKNDQTADCGSSTCSSKGRAQALSDHSTGITDGTISTIGFIGGGALLVGGAILFFTGGHSSAASSPSGMLLVPSVGPAGGGMWLRGEF